MVIVLGAVRSSTAKLHNPPDREAEKRSTGRTGGETVKEREREKKKEEEKIRISPKSGQQESKHDRGECESSRDRTACVGQKAEGG
jgi:hypothetical protein